MSNEVKLTSKLPGKEDWNALDAYADELRADHTLKLGCWVVFDVPKGVTNWDEDGKLTPYVRVRQVEVLTTDGSAPDGIRELIEQAYTERTGKAMLPIPGMNGEAVEDEPEAADGE